MLNIKDLIINLREDYRVILKNLTMF